MGGGLWSTFYEQVPSENKTDKFLVSITDKSPFYQEHRKKGRVCFKCNKLSVAKKTGGLAWSMFILPDYGNYSRD